MARIYVSLNIESYSDDLEIKIIDSLLPLSPHFSFQKGTPMRLVDFPQDQDYPSSLWQFNGPALIADEIDIPMKKMLETLLPFKKELLYIKENLGFEIFLSVSIVIFNHNSPLVTIEHAWINLLSELGLDISVDVHFDDSLEPSS